MADLIRQAKTLKKYLKAEQHLDYCKDFLKQSSENKHMSEAFKRLRCLIPNFEPLKDLLQSQWRDWNDDTISKIANQIEVNNVNLLKTLEESNWEERWAIAVNFAKSEIKSYNHSVTLQAEQRLRAAFERRRAHASKLPTNSLPSNPPPASRPDPSQTLPTQQTPAPSMPADSSFLKSSSRICS